jgi:hypothetical protein
MILQGLPFLQVEGLHLHYIVEYEQLEVSNVQLVEKMNFNLPLLCSIFFFALGTDNSMIPEHWHKHVIEYAPPNVH